MTFGCGTPGIREGVLDHHNPLSPEKGVPSIEQILKPYPWL
jgi:hypothetical protein